MSRPFTFCLIRSRGRIAPFIMDDLAEALAAVGCRSALLDLEQQGFYAAQRPEEMAGAARALMERIAWFQPDFIVSYGLAGIIETGVGSHLWEDLRIPYLVFCFDMPLGQEDFFRAWGASDLMTVFCWDLRYKAFFDACGVKRCFHLPLGVNARVFGKTAAGSGDEVSFVGSINARLLDCELPCAGELRLVQKRFLELKAQQPCVPFEDLLVQAACSSGVLPPAFETFRGSAGYARFVGDLLAQADARYRLAAIRSVQSIRVFGNEDWLRLLPPSVFAGEIGYGRDLADVYHSSGINLNLTNSHLQTAVNQRVFDCPAAGGFLLSDYRADLEQFFEPHREIIFFRTLDEMADLIAKYRAEPHARQKIAQAARQRVLAEHTWDCRMRTMLNMLEQAGN